MRHQSVIAALIAAGCIFALPAAAAPIIYVHDAHATLAMLDLSTGASSVIGTLPSVMTDIALSPSGELFGVDLNSLWRIDLTTAQGTRVGSTGYTLNALTFAPDGTLYAAGLDRLVTLDTTTGSATSIGIIDPYGSAGDLVFDSAGQLLLTTTDNNLLRLDPHTASPTLIGHLDHTNVFGLAMVDGTLYGVSDSERVSFTIDPATAATGPATALPPSLVGAYGATSSASNNPVAAAVPEPAGLCLLAAAVLLLPRRRR
ncbi:MAG: SMP-30/gluconolactonase/LRE family protein [Tepidisphaerales bacterium]